jgi:hypothetical protein
MAPRGLASVAEAEGGYRRGVVMGLTMAEIMLLFVFCLLLVAAGMVSDRDSKIEQAKTQIAVISAEKTALGRSGLPPRTRSNSDGRTRPCFRRTRGFGRRSWLGLDRPTPLRRFQKKAGGN